MSVNYGRAKPPLKLFAEAAKSAAWAAWTLSTLYCHPCTRQHLQSLFEDSQNVDNKTGSGDAVRAQHAFIQQARWQARRSCKLKSATKGDSGYCRM